MREKEPDLGPALLRDFPIPSDSRLYQAMRVLSWMWWRAGLCHCAERAKIARQKSGHTCYLVIDHTWRKREALRQACQTVLARLGFGRCARVYFDVDIVG